MNMLNTEDLKVILNLEKLIRESTSETLLEPDTDRYERIVQMICLNEDVCKEGIKEIKKRLSARHTKTLLYALELLEFCTCLGKNTFWQEINRKEFLQNINQLMNIKTLPNEVKDKALY